MHKKVHLQDMEIIGFSRRSLRNSLMRSLILGVLLLAKDPLKAQEINKLVLTTLNRKNTDPLDPPGLQKNGAFIYQNLQKELSHLTQLQILKKDAKRRYKLTGTRAKLQKLRNELDLIRNDLVFYEEFLDNFIMRIDKKTGLVTWFPLS